MSYPENVLAAGEQVVLHRHPHWNRLIWPVVVLVLLTGSGGVRVRIRQLDTLAADR